MCVTRPAKTAANPSTEVFMTVEHIETAIIGAGQAGLATAYHLQRRGRPCLILDGNRRVGDNWSAMGLLAALLPGSLRRATGTAVSGSEMVLPDQEPGRRLPGDLRRAVRTPSADVDAGE